MMDINCFCHARYCGAAVRPDQFMCYKHWILVPADLRRLIWRHYRNEIEKSPSAEYLEAVKKAQEAVQQKEFEACLQTHGSECGCWKRLKNAEVVQGQAL
jgi:hypothetical protein